MDKNKFIKDNFGISDKTLKLVSEAEESIKEQFKHIENICEINQLRVMKAFADNRVSDSHFVATTGYGYDDLGRDTLDRVYADIMGGKIHTDNIRIYSVKRISAQIVITVACRSNKVTVRYTIVRKRFHNSKLIYFTNILYMLKLLFDTLLRLTYQFKRLVRYTEIIFYKFILIHK